MPAKATEVVSPAFGGPPVKGIKIEEGYQCTFPSCDYASKSQRTIANHWSDKHRKAPKAQGTQKSRECKVQTLFFPQPCQYFTVEPSITFLQAEDPYAIFLQHVLPSYTCPFHVAPTESRNINPLLKMTQWAVYLAPYLGAEDSRISLVSLASLPQQASDPALFPLVKLTIAYLQRAHDIIIKASFTTRKIAKKYPPYVSCSCQKG